MSQEREFRIHLRGDYCVYCGERPETLEHFPPKCHTQLGFLLPACRECNQLAGSRWPEDFILRAEMVKDKLRHRYRKQLASPEWAQIELRGLGRTLRTGVERWRNQAEKAKRRIAWNAVSYLPLIDRNSDFARIFVEDDIFESSRMISLRKLFDDAPPPEPIRDLFA